MDNKIIGKIGENLACGYLVNKGYSILDRNYREKFGEIDIIAKSPDKTLVFIEVKTISKSKPPVEKSPASYPHLAGLGYSLEDEVLNPEDQMSASKIKKFRKISEWYANKHPELMSKNGYRLDVIALSLKDKLAEIKHYENIT